MLDVYLVVGCLCVGCVPGSRMYVFDVYLVAGCVVDVYLVVVCVLDVYLLVGSLCWMCPW